MSALDAIEAVFALRQRYWANGYRPLAVWGPGQRLNDKGQPLNSPGKQPRGRWREAAAQDPPEAALQSPDPRALNTGLLCDLAPGFDIDVLDEGLADHVVHLVEATLGPTPLVRIGRAPKILLVYQAQCPFSKIQTPEFIMPNGTKAKIEVLGQGQQFVADGIHPDTSQPYVWTDGSPETVSLSELPTVTEEQARMIVEEADRLLRAAGGKEKEKPKASPASTRKPNGSDGDFFSRVKDAALADIAMWARALFPGARFEPGTGAWRVSSKDLGRELEEDISIHPGGIWDFGEEKALSPIDLVMDHAGAAIPIDAALWLCDKLRIDPSTLGYTPSRQSPLQPPRQVTLATGSEIVPAPREGISLDDFYAYMPMHSYIYTPSREMWPAPSINARIKPVALVDEGGSPVLNNEGKKKTIPASLWLDRNKPVEQMTWAPGLPMLIENRLISQGGWITWNKVSCFNLYRPPIIEIGDAKQARAWLDHLNEVFPDDVEHILHWLAHRIQRPQDKINHALVLGGLQGIGKDTLLEPVKRAVGPWNFSEITPMQMLGRFNGFVKSVILRISEARDLGDVDRYQFYEHLKVYTAAPPDVLRVDEKHLREYSVLNCCGVIITTNYKTDGIYLPADDRRHFVAWSDLRKEDFPDSYWSNLWGWYARDGAAHVAAYLATLDLSGFDAKAPPRKTPAFWAIVDASRAPEDAELADAIDRIGQPNTLTLNQLVSRAPEQFADWLLERKNSRKIPHRLEACGYVAVRNDGAKDGLWKVDGKRQVIYAKTDLSQRERITAAMDRVGAR
jgi:Family of unknown function (DUF5906)/Bifunctional DNA primase/polymerase, N-terminal